MTDLPIPQNCDAGDADTGVDGTGIGAPHLDNGPGPGPGGPPGPPGPKGHLLANFNGVSDDDNVTTLGGHVTPPDQGLCVGPAGAFRTAGISLGVPNNTSVVVEAVNESWSIYSTKGVRLFGPDNLADLFSDGFSSGDVSCNYDPGSKTFFFAEIGAPNGEFFETGLAVINAAHGYAAYGVDTAEGGACFPDFPQMGFDDNGFYLAINEFCGPDQEDFAGANLYALSKSQLASESDTINGVAWQGLSLDGIPVLTLRPAIGDGTKTEYLMNAVSYGADGNSVDVANTLGLWHVDGDKNLTSGMGSVTLNGKSIKSESYAFPVPAESTGDGSCSNYKDQGCVITSEQELNPDDSRLEQLQFVGGRGGGLYTSLNSAMTIGHDPTPVDGAAWFQVDPSGPGKVVHQGYVGLKGTNLLYPSIVRSGSGALMMGFSMTSPTLDPSTGYVTSKDGGKHFSPVQTTAVGSTAHRSYSDILFDEPRWGDYSAIAFDPQGGGVWMANEYIPSADEGGADVADNWGTRVWGLKP
ncbi:MAG TPA: hypothetical protein VH063_19990 [Gaiellaceae bacterium]|nr:hypothetical protein [Gaiellaceae bacterium]